MFYKINKSQINQSLGDETHPNAALRRAITALCAPAVVALMASQAPLAYADTASLSRERPYEHVTPRGQRGPGFRTNLPRPEIKEEAPKFSGRRNNGPFRVSDDQTEGPYQPVPRFLDNDYYRYEPTKGPYCETPKTPIFRASPDLAQTTANTPVTIDVLANDTFPEAKAPSVLVNGSANGAEIRVNEDGTITYTPARDFVGTDTFEYKIRGYAALTRNSTKQPYGYGDPATTTVTVTVTEAAPPAINTATIVINDTVVTDGDTFALADTDAAAGEAALFDGSQSILASGKRPSRFQWFVNDSLQQDGGSPTFAFKLADGTSQVRLFASDGDNGATSEVNVTVAAPPRVIIAKIAVNQTAVDNGGTITLPDTDATAGETATFDGSQSTLSSGAKPTRFRWFVNGELAQDNDSATFVVNLDDGTSTVRLLISDGEDSATSEVNVTVTEAAPQANTAIIAVNGSVVNDGGNIPIADTDTAMGESVSFDGSQTLIFGKVKPTRFQWFINGSDKPQQDSDSPVFATRLTDGTSQVRLVASASADNEDGFVSASSEVSVTIAAPPSQDTAIIAVNGSVVVDGGSFTVPDTDAVPGEGVSFDGSQTLIFGEVRPTRFRWFVGNSETPQQDGSNPQFAPRLPDGLSQVRLVAIFEGEGTISATSAVNVTVTAAAVTPPPPSTATILVNGTAVIDGAIALADSDAAPGEMTTFDGSQSTVAGARATRFQWFVNDTLQKDSTEEASFTFRLNDGASSVRLVASNGESNAASVVNVTVGGVAILADIPNLTPNQRSVARALDNVCSQLVQRAQANQALTADQQDLLERCQGILLAGAADQARALDELSAQDFNGARLQTLLFTNALYAGVMDRLMALRGGARGLSLAGLNIVIDGKSVPLAELQQMFGQMLGGGAAADEPGSLLGDKWGAWSRGNFTFGSKDASKADNGFDAKQLSLTAGLDYRLSEKMVIGGAVAFGSSNLSYDPNNEGGLDTQSWAVSVYGSRYAAKNFYLDGLVNAASSSFEAHRRISYNDALGTVQRDARGGTDGLTLSGGLSGGYDILYKGLTVSPNAGFFYVDSTIDSFREGGSRGLNLVYDEQNFKSLTTTLGVRVNYSWNLPFGVLVPYFRGDYVRELRNDVEAFSVHFASDAGNPATPIIVQSDNPDQSYFRLVAGLSGQFPFGISGYVEYQRLQGFEFVNFNDLSMGLRMQYRY